MDFGIETIRAAAQRIEGRVRRTPLLSSPMLDELCGARVLVKAEALQLTGSFKIRGALNTLLSLPEAERAAGVLAFSTGNHGQAVAASARMTGATATIVMPQDAPQIKVDGCRWWGAEVVFYDPATQDREVVGRELVEQRRREVLGALPALRDVPRHGAPDAELGAQLPDDLVLAVVVLREGVDRHDRLHAELADDLDVLAQVRQPRPHVARALLEEAVRQRPARSDGESPGVRLHRPHGRDDDGGVRGQTVCAALDVEEPFGAHVGAETGLGDDDLGAGERDPVGDDRARPRRDVPEGAAVDEGRPALEGLEQVRRPRSSRAGG